MSKFFLIFLSFTLINTVTVFSSRNMQDQAVDEEFEVVEENSYNEQTTEEDAEESPPEEYSEDTDNATEETEDNQAPEEDEAETSEEENPEEEVETLTDIEIELTDEEKTLVFKYIGKIDLEYLMSLTSDGITEDENILIIEHLKEKLTEEEYEEVEDLIVRFLYSMEQ